MRVFSFTATLIPVSLAAAIALKTGIKSDWPLFPLILLGGLLINAASDLTNEYYDFKLGVDRKGVTGSSGVLIEGSLKPKQVLNASILFYSLAVLFSIYFVWLRGPWMALVIAAGLIAGFTYTSGKHGYKYYALGEPMCFLFYGPVMAIGAYMALAGGYSNSVTLASIPVGFLVAAILNGNNLRDIKDDTASNIRTIMIILGLDRARIYYSSMVILPYIFVIIFAVFHVTPVWSLLTLLTVPVMVSLIRTAYSGDKRSMLPIDMNTAKLHLAFGLVYLASYFIR